LRFYPVTADALQFVEHRPARHALALAAQSPYQPNGAQVAALLWREIVEGDHLDASTVESATEPRGHHRALDVGQVPCRHHEPCVATEAAQEVRVNRVALGPFGFPEDVVVR